MKILFVSSEAYPLIKTGGLADVVYGLPRALSEAGADVRLVLPAYREVLKKIDSQRILGWLDIQGNGYLHSVRVLEVETRVMECPVWLVDCPALFDRPGNPYLSPQGFDWADNAERFTVFSRAAALLATDQLNLGWYADAVHSHDWQAGLVNPLLESASPRPQRVFTIHNLAYGGHFSREQYQALELYDGWLHADGLEFHGGTSFLKAGIVYADAVTTVSPTYAREICTPEFGYGMEGLLQSRQYKLHGILNGIDTEQWNPATDPFLATHYSATQIQPGKQANKQALLQHFEVPASPKNLQQPLIGLVGRLVEQKGIDLVLDVIPFLIEYHQARFVIVGSGQTFYEQRLLDLAERYSENLHVFVGYNERLAHLLEAGSDLFLMPSRFEPCGLNQMYSLNYGTLPVVYHTGGLADTVVNAEAHHIRAGTANGFVFYAANSPALGGTLTWALALYKNKSLWQQLQLNGMQRDFSWGPSAMRYMALYRR